MLSAFKDKPDAQEIIRQNSAACRKNVTHRIMNAMKILFRGKYLWKEGAEEFKTPDFHNSTQSAGNDEKQDLSVA